MIYRAQPALIGRILNSALAVASFTLLAVLPTPTEADVYVLATGGEIRGELVQSDDSQYVVKPYAGGTITLEASRVVDVIKQQPLEILYDRTKIQHEDTVAGHLLMAKWCGEKSRGRLKDEREFHLEQVVRLETDHAEARRLLGHMKENGVWMTHDDAMRSRGKVKYRGKWMLPQARQIAQEKEQHSEKVNKWKKDLKRYHRMLDSNRRSRGKAFILAIEDHHAVDALIRNLESSEKTEDREIYAQALDNVGTGKAINALVQSTLEDEDENFRYFCLELLAKEKPASAVAPYISALKSKDNWMVNRAALGLATLRDTMTVEPLIDSLITTHKYKLGKDNGGATTYGFGSSSNGSQGTSFTQGSQAKIVVRNHRNEQVLSALVELTGEDFHYDVAAWKSWYATQKPAAPKFNSRRDK